MEEERVEVEYEVEEVGEGVKEEDAMQWWRKRRMLRRVQKEVKVEEVVVEEMDKEEEGEKDEVEEVEEEKSRQFIFVMCEPSGGSISTHPQSPLICPSLHLPPLPIQ